MTSISKMREFDAGEIMCDPRSAVVGAAATLPRQQDESISSKLDEVFSTEENDQTQLVEKYCKSVKERKYTEAIMTKQRLSRLVEDQIKTRAEDLETFARKNMNEKKLFEAFLFYQISSDFYGKKSNPKLAVEGLKNCAWGLTKTNITMMKSDVTNKPIVGDYVIPLIEDIRHQIQNLANVDDELRCLGEVLCLHYIELSLDSIDSHESKEEIIREGLNLMESKFGDDSVKYRVYGHLLNNLGYVCEKTSRFGEAVVWYQKAIDAEKQATDFPSEEEKKESIELSENNLKKIKEKLGEQ